MTDAAFARIRRRLRLPLIAAPMFLVSGVELVVAACRSGANCGPTNDVLPLAPCSAGVELGCTERYTAVDELTATLGSQDLDEANLLAQDIQRNMAYRDPGRLMKYLPF